MIRLFLVFKSLASCNRSLLRHLFDCSQEMPLYKVPFFKWGLQLHPERSILTVTITFTSINEWSFVFPGKEFLQNETEMRETISLFLFFVCINKWIFLLFGFWYYSFLTLPGRCPAGFLGNTVVWVLSILLLLLLWGSVAKINHRWNITLTQFHSKTIYIFHFVAKPKAFTASC